MTRTSRHIRSLAGVALAILVGATLAACGSSSSSTKFQACLKSHGVNLPSGERARGAGGAGGAPGGGPGAPGSDRRSHRGFFGGGGFGGGARSGKNAAAFSACRKDLPAGGGGFRPGARGGGAHFTARTLAAFSACVKQHGYTLPKPNTSGSGPVFPRSIETNAKFVQASRACSADLRPAAGAGLPAA